MKCINAVSLGSANQHANMLLLQHCRSNYQVAKQEDAVIGGVLWGYAGAALLPNCPSTTLRHYAQLLRGEAPLHFPC